MTFEEAKKLARAFGEIDGGCFYCTHDLCDKFNEIFEGQFYMRMPLYDDFYDGKEIKVEKINND